MFSQASVKNSVQKGGGVHTPWADTPLGRPHLPKTATASDGTRPTGMNSCFFYYTGSRLQQVKRCKRNCLLQVGARCNRTF